MAVTCNSDLNAKKYDFVNASCNAKIDELVYCQLPEGFKQQGKA